MIYYHDCGCEKDCGCRKSCDCEKGCDCDVKTKKYDHSNFDEISEKILNALNSEEFFKVSNKFADKDILFFEKLLNNHINLVIEDLFFDPFNNSTFYVRFKNIPYTIEVIKSTFNFYVYVAI